MRARDVLLDVFAAAVAAADPRAATAAALASVQVVRGARVHLIAIGKAADGMAAAAATWLHERGERPAGGLIVAASDAATAPDERLRQVIGDHPVPDAASLHAADAVGRAAADVREGDMVLVLLSGGASSLIAAPISEDLTLDDLAACTRLLLASGADIATVNTVRKRFTRWGGGRLAQALAPAQVHGLTISDVAGDDLAVIGSGPCTADRSTAGEVRALLGARGLTSHLPPAIVAHLDAVAAGHRPETPKPGDLAFARVEARVILSNAGAREGALARAHATGLRAALRLPELEGEARTLGAQIAATARAGAAEMAPDERPTLLVWGGEPTVTLGDTTGLGGRCQELALAAAEQLAAGEEARAGTTLLAAGTDGRDGPTDAAGAVVDQSSWARMRDAGIDPGAALRAHDAYHALDAVHALIRTGSTGTNVRDLVLVLIEPEATAPRARQPGRI